MREGLRGCAGQVHPATGAEAVILPRGHRTRIGLRDYHRPLYQDRHLGQRVLNRLKPFRRMATGYDSLARHCVSLLTLVCADIGRHTQL